MTDPTAAPPGAGRTSPPTPVQGLKVYDETTNRYGTVQDVWPNDVVHVRPLGGGVEWTARRSTIRPALTSELLALRVKAEREARLPL